MITIQPLTEPHLPALLALYQELYHVPTDPQCMRENFLRMAASPDYHVVGAFTADGELVGSALAIICHDIIAECRPWAMVENVIVTDRVRGQGVGKLLMQSLEAFASERHCSYIQLTSSYDLAPAHHFYGAAGYSGDLVKAFRKRL